MALSQHKELISPLNILTSGLSGAPDTKPPAEDSGKLLEMNSKIPKEQQEVRRTCLHLYAMPEFPARSFKSVFKEAV